MLNCLWLRQVGFLLQSSPVLSSFWVTLQLCHLYFSKEVPIFWDCFPLGIFSLGSMSLLNFIESRVHDLYLTVLLHSFHENEEHCYFIVLAAFPLYILNSLLATACNQMESKVPSTCILKKDITNTFQEFAGQPLLYLFFAYYMCRCWSLHYFQIWSIADSASCSQKALSASSVLFSVSVTPPCAFPSLSLSIC